MPSPHDDTSPAHGVKVTEQAVNFEGRRDTQKKRDSSPHPSSSRTSSSSGAAVRREMERVRERMVRNLDLLAYDSTLGSWERGECVGQVMRDKSCLERLGGVVVEVEVEGGVKEGAREVEEEEEDKEEKVRL